MSAKDPEPVVIVRKKGGHAAHHGGAWKVAYADFVTAMMAFFLVMWLVGQSKEVKQAVGGYFRDPGVFDFEKGKGVLPGGQPGVEPGGAPVVSPPPPTPGAEAERARLLETAVHIRQDLSELKGFDTLREQVIFSVTAEGLRIDLVDKASSSFFDSGSAALRGESEQILSLIAHELGTLPNDVVIEGHTDSRQYASGDHYGNWELSAERANAARRVMERTGLHTGQIRAVRGFADRDLRLPDAPVDPRNRRVSIVVRSDATRSLEESLRTPLKEASPSVERSAPDAGSAPKRPEDGAQGPKTR